MTNDLNPAEVKAARRAMNFGPFPSRGNNEALEAAIRAYLTASLPQPEGETAELVERWRLLADDPMWADHAEVSKALCRRTADAITSLSQRVAVAALRERELLVVVGDAARDAGARLAVVDHECQASMRTIAEERARAEAAEAQLAHARDEIFSLQQQIDGEF